MVASSMQISETNSSSATVTQGVTNLNFGSTDAVNLVAANFPITAGTRSYEKWVRFNMSTIGGSTYVCNFKVWMSSSYATGCTIRTNCSSTNNGQAASAFPTSSGPHNSSAFEGTYFYALDLSTATPATANAFVGGFGGSCSSAWLSGTSGFSDYMIFQVAASSVNAVAGQTLTLSFQYDEVA